MKTKWLITSDAPDAKFVGRVIKVVSALPFAPVKFRICGEKKIFSGTITGLKKVLNHRLLLDHKELQKECSCEKCPYKYSYIATRKGYSEFALAVLTRLYSDSKKGSVLYGDTIVRTGNTTFELYGDK